MRLQVRATAVRRRVRNVLVECSSPVVNPLPTSNNYVPIKCEMEAIAKLPVVH
jgi:hypothetical protein